MTLRIAYPVHEPQRTGAAYNSAENSTLIKHPQTEKPCKGISADDSLAAETVFMLSVWYAFIHQPFSS